MFLSDVRNNPDWLDNLAGDGRYSWKIFLDLPPQARVLDLGCGLGNLTRSVAPHVAETVAFDLTWERLEFTRERIRKFNLEDRVLTMAGGDGASLPFADNSFDCVMLSGVLEWVASDDSLWRGVPSKLGKLWRMLSLGFGASSPRRVQLDFLREIRRVLKPDGQLFVAIENRTNLEYFRGRVDHHSGILFGSLLPRPLANLWSIYKTRSPYRTYTYSYLGYRRLMRQAGFAKTLFLGLTPGYSHLREIIPYGWQRARWIDATNNKTLSQLRKAAFFIPALGMVSSDGSARRSSLGERLLSKISGDTGIGPITFKSLTVSQKRRRSLRSSRRNAN